MKSAEFSKQLGKAADLLKAVQGPANAALLRRLATLFEAVPTKAVSDVTKKLESLKFNNGSFLQTKVENITTVMQSLTEFVSSISPKFKADFELTAGLLAKFGHAPFDEFIERSLERLTAEPVAKSTGQRGAANPPNTDLVDRYYRILESALGDDSGFRSAYARLEADREMRAPEVSALAKRFALASVKARPAALKKIFSRHQALMISRAAAAATAGRVAG